MCIICPLPLPQEWEINRYSLVTVLLLLMCNKSLISEISIDFHFTMNHDTRQCGAKTLSSCQLFISLTRTHTYIHPLSFSLSRGLKWGPGEARARERELLCECYCSWREKEGEGMREIQYRLHRGKIDVHYRLPKQSLSDPALPRLSLSLSFPLQIHREWTVNWNWNRENWEIKYCIQIALYQYVTVRERHKECERERQRIHVYWLSVTVRGKVLNIVTSTISAAPNLETFHLPCWHIILRENNF